MRILTLFALLTLTIQGHATEWNTPGAGNPFIPGYFADPTIRKFGDTWYLYATTDGTGNGYGPAQVWGIEGFQKLEEHRDELAHHRSGMGPRCGAADGQHLPLLLLRTL